MFNYNAYSACTKPQTNAIYMHTVTPKCEKAYMSTGAFRVLLRSVGCGFRNGRFVNEDGMQLYGWRVREKDGSLSAIITDVVESSPASRRTSVTFDVDHNYAIHRDRYLRDVNHHKNFNMLGYIHSHPNHMTYFSQTDVDTMAEYTRSDMEVMLSGLVTFFRGELELTMYAVTQNGNQLNIWHLPLTISDEEVNRRKPACRDKSFEQIWCEATGASAAPRFRMLEAPEDRRERSAAAAERHEPAPAVRLPVDLSAITEGAEGMLCGRMEAGTLHLFLAPVAAAASPSTETAESSPQPADEPPAAPAPEPEPVPAAESMDFPRPDPMFESMTFPDGDHADEEG